MAHSLEAKRIRRELDKHLAYESAQCGSNLVWTAADSIIIDTILAAADRKLDIKAMFLVETDPKVKTALGAELRLHEGHINKLIKQLLGDIPAELQPQTRASARARRAANQRWHPPRPGMSG